MKVFVTGATGYIGSVVCEALRAAGHAVTGLARTADKARLLESRGFVARLGDLEDAAALAAGCADSDAVIHTARDNSARGGAIDRAAVEAMLAALEGTRKVFIYTSGIWVMGDTRGRMNGEMGALEPPELVKWRPAVEEMTIEAADRGVRSMVLRPGMVYGRKGGALGGMMRMARERGVVRIVGQGRNHWSSVHVDDLADLYVKAVEAPAAGQLFIVCGGMPQPVEKLASAVAAVFGIEDGVERVPLELALAEMGPVAECLALDLKAGSTKAARYFGWTVRRPDIYEEIALRAHAD